jgi:hypothetical protein
VVTATCDSLEAQVDYYWSLYLATREERDQYKEMTEKRTTSEGVSNGLKRSILILTFIVGVSAGVIITNKVKRNGTKL